MNAVESTSNATNTFGSIMVGRRLAMHDRAANRPAGQLDSAGVDLRGKDSFGRQTCLLGEVRKLALHAPCPRTSNQSATTLNSSPRSGGTLRKAHMAPRWRRARWQQTGRSVPGASVDGVGGRGGALQLPIDAAVLVGRCSSSSSALRAASPWPPTHHTTPAGGSLLSAHEHRERNWRNHRNPLPRHARKVFYGCAPRSAHSANAAAAAARKLIGSPDCDRAG